MSTLNAGETLQPFKPLRNNLIFDSSGNLVGIQNDRAVGNDLRIGGGSGVGGTFATLIATTALKLNSGATFDLYNTADQTTNYERLRADWSGSIARILTQFGGSAGARTLRLGVSVTGVAPDNYIEIRAGAPFLNYFTGTTSQSVGNQWNGSFTASSGTQTALSIVNSFNQSGTAGYTALDINPTETATGSGTKLLQRWAVDGSAKAQIDNSGSLSATNLTALNTLGLATAPGTTGDVNLSRDAADTLALRRLTNAQTFRVYNTFTDGSNYERLQIVAGASNTDLVTFQAGTGSPRPLRMYTTGAQDLQFGTANVMRWTISASGHLSAFADNTYDIGASGANRPRNVYVGSGIVAGGVISTTNYTSALYLIITDGVTAPAATAGQAKLYVDTADGDLKIIFGDGTIKTIVTDT